jgi:hypothetical protein
MFSGYSEQLEEYDDVSGHDFLTDNAIIALLLLSAQLLNTVCYRYRDLLVDHYYSGSYQLAQVKNC